MLVSISQAMLAWTAIPAFQRAPSVARSAVVDMKVGSVSEAELAKPFDLVVVGGGPAGVAGALKGAYLGKKVLLVDKPKAVPEDGGLDFFFGGPTGLFSKALRDCAKAYDVVSLDTMGLDRDVIFKQVQNSCLKLARNNAQSSVEMLSKFKVSYLQGDATLVDTGAADEVELTVKPHASPDETLQVRSSKVLLCTGSYATQPPGIPFDTKRVLDADSVNGLDFLPRSVVVAGSGIIAIEMSNIFRKLGASVTMVVRGSAMSALEKIGLDDTIAERLLRGLADQGVTVLENTVVDSFECIADADDDGMPKIGGDICETIGMELKSKDASSGEMVPASTPYIEADLYLACLGRRPRTRGTSLGLEEYGVECTERSGHIVVGDDFQTSRPGVYAAGDCIEGPALASTGVDQAQRAVLSMFGPGGEASTEGAAPFPIGVWTIPEVGYYGMTCEQAKAAGYDADVGIATYDACLRGRVFSPDGMLKLVFDRDTARILGVHIIGTDACELVHYGMDLVAKKATLFDVINTLFTAVTFHELFKEAALNGNEKLEFGIQWQEVLSELQATIPSSSDELDERELHRRFDEIDTSGDGSLDEDELLAVFRAIGSDISPQLIANLIRLVDDDGNGTIEWPEFYKIFTVLKKMEDKQAAAVARDADQPQADPELAGAAA